MVFLDHPAQVTPQIATLMNSVKNNLSTNLGTMDILVLN